MSDRARTSDWRVSVLATVGLAGAAGLFVFGASDAHVAVGRYALAVIAPLVGIIALSYLGSAAKRREFASVKKDKSQLAI